MIDSEKAWEIIKRNAEKAQQTKIVFKSLRKRKPYIVKAIKINTIIIQRKKLKSQANLRLKDLMSVSFQELRTKGMIKRTKLAKPVAKETALVLFHPELSWSRDKKFIQIKNKS